MRNTFLDPDEFERFSERAGENCSFADLDDRPLQQCGVLDHQFDQAFGVGFLSQAELFGNGLVSAKHVPWPQAGLRDQAAQFFDRQRFVVIIYLLVVDAVFTKQLCQIAARRSGRFFVNDNFVSHRF